MNDVDLNKYIYQILDGGFRYKQYHFVQPPPTILYKAEILYEETLRRAIFLGIETEDFLLKFYTDKGFWSDKQEKDIKKLYDIIDTLKLQLYKSYVGFKSLDKQKESIAVTKHNLLELLEKRGSLTIYSAESSAMFAKNQYIACAGCGLELDRLDGELSIILCGLYVNSILDDDLIRQIVLSEPWRRYWSVEKEPEKLFDIPVIKMCYSQRSVITWSKFYDNIRNSAEPPSDAVINDNDLLDGWLIWESDRQKNEEKKRAGDRFAKYGDNAEIFIPVSSIQEAQSINSLNVGENKTFKDRKLKSVQKFGKIEEQDIPEIKRMVKMQANQLAMNRRKG